MPVGGERAEADANRGMTRSRLAADLWSLKGLDRRTLCCNICVATNLTIRRINRRDSAIVGAALGAAMQRNSAHYFTWLNSYRNFNLPQTFACEVNTSNREDSRPNRPGM